MIIIIIIKQQKQFNPFDKMTLNFNQLHYKPNCATVNIFCTSDKDCHLQCSSAVHYANSHDTGIDKEQQDSSTIIINLCNLLTNQCEPNMIQKGYYDMAINDLKKLSQMEKFLPKAMWDYIKINDGKRFIVARARFYENLSFHLKEGTLLDAAIQRIINEHKKNNKRNYSNKLQQINIVDDDNDNISMDLYVKQLFGRTAKPSSSQDIILTRDLEHDKKRGEYCTLIATNTAAAAATAATIKSPSKPNDKIVAFNNQYPLQFHCNEEMNAGIMMAAYQDNDGNILPICVCTYPYYLTGPTCKHRTYNRVVDYELWEKTGYADFLTDPFNDYKKANRICKSKTINTTAVFDERDGCFYCQPLAAHFAQSLQMRGPYEPALILDKDYIDSLNVNQSFKINIDYLDLLNKFY
uniref:Wsv306-like protein n=1 Tax=Metapenaeus ensis majanivirus TaxID=2984279 RepID=A0A9C7CF79_9VIRU|nr:MAG: wsv306-like protein [Metapenaeus ensis majanivirus]